MALCTFSVSVAGAEVDSSDVISGFGVTPAEINRLENSEVLAFSDEEFENTKQELITFVDGGPRCTTLICDSK